MCVVKEIEKLPCQVFPRLLPLILPDSLGENEFLQRWLKLVLAHVSFCQRWLKLVLAHFEF